MAQASTFKLKRGDVRPALQVQLLDTDDSAYNLTTAGVASVALLITLADGTVLSRPMTIDDAANGIVSYTWLTTDWDSGNLVVGLHRMEYECTLSAGGVHTIPTERDLNDYLEIEPDMNP